MVVIKQVHEEQVSGLDFSWSQLWWDDLDEAGVSDVWVAFDNDTVVGFQTVSPSCLCVAIEVRDECLGQGIATELVEQSGCDEPESDECPGFWEKF